MNVLCLDHVCHQKTKSFDFFIDILKSNGFSVDVFYYDRHYRVKPSKEKISWADVIVYLEFLPSRYRLIFWGKRTVFLPMYDNEWGSKWQWRRIALSGIGVISFSRKISSHARQQGVTNILDVQFFLNPNQFPQERGERKRVFLWERGDIDRKTAEVLFPPNEGYVFDIKRRDEFLDREHYLRRISLCDIMIAPRRKEGIGMVFLEAMAMGKCVVAHNDATMNEYIQDGESGILFCADDPREVPYAIVSHVRDRIRAFSKQLWSHWQDDAARIAPFVSGQKPCRPSLLNRVKTVLAFPLFLIEGLWCRMVRS